jgi:phage tail protein X
MLSSLLLLCSAVFAQNDLQKQNDMQPMSAPQTAPSEAQKSFTEIKALAGTWRGQATIKPPMQGMENTNMEVSMRITSRGNALLHEMKEAAKPADPTKYDNPVTMFYLDGDQLLLTHYCDAGNRPRMAARTSSDGKTVEFDFLDVSGSTKYGHMQHAVFTVVDANHHVEDWTFLMRQACPRAYGTDAGPVRSAHR